jgi:hypothetical protein
MVPTPHRSHSPTLRNVRSSADVCVSLFSHPVLHANILPDITADSIASQPCGQSSTVEDSLVNIFSSTATTRRSLLFRRGENNCDEVISVLRKWESAVCEGSSRETCLQMPRAAGGGRRRRRRRREGDVRSASAGRVNSIISSIAWP